MNARPLTVQDILDGYTNPQWCGVGSLGCRRSALEARDPQSVIRPGRVNQADAAIIKHANRQGWSADDLFEWLNSKLGRWFADVVLVPDASTDTFTADLASAVGFGLLAKMDA